MPQVPEVVEDAALSVSLFEIEGDNGAEPVGWQVDIVLRDQPQPDGLAAVLAPALAEAGAALLGIDVAPVPPEEWVRAVELRLPPIRIGRFVIHGAHAREAVPPGAVAIEVEAGLAFGSGEHATTRLCLAAIDHLARRRRFRRVLDLGCGSGLLAIAAARCWPARVLAVDHDPIAVRVASANASLNRVVGRVRVLAAEGYRHPAIRRQRPFDLVLANILADPLIELAPGLRAHLAPGGRAVLSGLLSSQADAVAAAHRKQGLRLLDVAREGPWAALTFAHAMAGRR